MTEGSFFALPFFDTFGFFILLSVFVLLLILESLFELRQRKQSRKTRWFTNAFVAATGLPVARLLLLPLMVYAAYQFREYQLGLLNWLQWPAAAEWLPGLLLLDYGIYFWHRLNHVWPFLWRFHQVHHIDQDMDLSTALRFHAGEILLSVPFRLGIVAISGVSPLMLLVYEIIFEACTMFHHSNLRLPIFLERKLAWLIITPRIHGIHHSVVKNETNSNYSTVLNCWDRLHRTLKLNVPQKHIRIGVPYAQENDDNRFKKLLLQPFYSPEPWQFKNAEKPLREELPETRQLQS